MATKAEIVAELKTYSAYNDIKESVLMRELKPALEQRLALAKGVSIEEVKVVEKAAHKKSTTRKSTKSAKVDFGDSELDMDLLNDDSLVKDFYDVDDYEDVGDDFPFL